MRPPPILLTPTCPLVLQESPEEALVRELYEELGIIVNPANLTPVCIDARSPRHARPPAHWLTHSHVIGLRM